MEAITQLEHSYFLAKSGGGDYRECIDWALERMRGHEAEKDDEIALLATTSTKLEALKITEQVIERYSGQQALDEQLAAGKYLVALRHDYLRGKETVGTLEAKLTVLYERLKFPIWLSVLCRNCRYARELRLSKELFDKEFAYLARLWAIANSRSQFESRYNHGISTRHDAL
jgi:hypothetical protein